MYVYGVNKISTKNTLKLYIVSLSLLRKQTILGINETTKPPPNK